MAAEDDTAWKDILDTHLEEFLNFFFPEIHRDIDGSRGYETLDKELQVILRGSKGRKRLADKLVKVHLRSDPQAAVHLHIEVQKRPEADFERRMFEYNYRIDDRRGGEVISLAVLTDSRSRRRRDCYERRRWTFAQCMRYPLVELRQYEGRRAVLEASRSVFAVVVLAHLEAQRTRGKPVDGLEAKWSLLEMLYERRRGKKDIIVLYKFIDSILKLPAGLELEIQDRLRALEGKINMPYVSSIERFAEARGKAEGKARGLEEGKARGLEEGEAKGLREAIALALKLRFGPEGLKLLARVREVEDAKALRAILTAVHKAKTVDALRGKLPQA